MPPSGTSGQTFKLHYTSSVLDSVMVPGVSGRDVGTTVSAGVLTQWRWPDGTYLHFSYDGSNRVDSTTDVRGGATKLHYAAYGLVDTAKVYYGSGGTKDSSVTVFSPWQAAGYATGSSGQIAIDNADAVTTIFGPRVGVADNATFLVDQWGAPTAVIDPLNMMTTYVRGDTAVPALVTAIQFPNSRLAQMSYTRRGNLDTLVDSTWGAGKFPRLVTTWVYSDANDPDSPSQITAPDGTVSHYTYNSLGLTDSMLDPRGHGTKYTYETSLDSTRGQVLNVNDHAVGVWIQSAGADSVKDLVDSVHYNAHGNSIRVFDPAGGITKYTRDAAGRDALVDDPLGFRQLYGYDVMDRVIRKIAVHAVGDSSSVCVSEAFNCDNLVLDGLNPSGSADTTLATYTQGLLTQVRDPRSVPHSYRYDLRGLLVADIDEAGAVDSAFYDEGGLVLKNITRHHDTLTYSYDVASRQTKWTIPARSDTLFGIPRTAPADSVLTTYDSLSNVLSTTNRHGVNGRSYFEDGSVAVDTSRGSELAKDTVAYTYDSGGRLAKLSWPRGDTIRYFYKTDGDLDSVAAKWKAASISQQKVFKFQWDSLGRRRQIQYPHYGMTATYHYDALGTLRKLLSINPAGSDTNRFNFTFTQDSVDVTGRPLHQLVTCDSFTPPTTLIGAPCGGWLPSETRTRYNRLGALVAQYQQNLATPRR